MRKTQAEIAQAMGKDPAWVSRSLKRLHANFDTEFSRPGEARLIAENTARFDSLYAKSMQTAEATTGHARIAALRLATEIARQQADYQVVAGYVGNRRTHPEQQKCPRCELADEISPEDIDAIWLATVEDEVSKRMSSLPESSG